MPGSQAGIPNLWSDRQQDNHLSKCIKKNKKTRLFGTQVS